MNVMIDYFANAITAEEAFSLWNYGHLITDPKEAVIKSKTAYHWRKLYWMYGISDE